jgi:hypothetical protein
MVLSAPTKDDARKQAALLWGMGKRDWLVTVTEWKEKVVYAS